jgi:hypothetical protein
MKLISPDCRRTTWDLEAIPPDEHVPLARQKTRLDVPPQTVPDMKAALVISNSSNSHSEHDKLSMAFSIVNALSMNSRKA